MTDQLPGEQAARRSLTPEAFAAWKANHPLRSDSTLSGDDTAGSRTHNMIVPDNCTGYLDPYNPGHGIQHDGPTCPVHEDAREDAPPADVEPFDASQPVAMIASLARTALDDPAGLPEDDDEQQHYDARATNNDREELLKTYAVAKLDAIIEASFTVTVDAMAPEQLTTDPTPDGLWLRVEDAYGSHGGYRVTLMGPRETVRAFIMQHWGDAEYAAELTR